MYSATTPNLKTIPVTHLNLHKVNKILRLRFVSEMKMEEVKVLALKNSCHMVLAEYSHPFVNIYKYNKVLTSNSCFISSW